MSIEKAMTLIAQTDRPTRLCMYRRLGPTSKYGITNTKFTRMPGAITPQNTLSPSFNIPCNHRKYQGAVVCSGVTWESAWGSNGACQFPTVTINISSAVQITIQYTSLVSTSGRK